MAADADPTDGELTKDVAPDDTDDGTSATPEETEPTAAEVNAAGGDTVDGEDYEAAVDELDTGAGEVARPKRPMPHVRLAAIFGLAVVLVLATTVGWLGFRAYQSHQAQAQRQLFLQVARQGALNLTTIDWQHAEADVQRVLDSATGEFYDQFSSRKQPFIDVLKKAQSKSVGTITEAGLESDAVDRAQALVAVSLKTSDLGGGDQPPREWRMRISLEKTGNEVKISDVTFVR